MCAVLRPTMVFYFTEELGGSIEQYGYMGSLHSIAAIVMTPVFGKWLDRSGNQFRVGYLVSSIAGITSYLMYFTASLLPTGHNSVAVYYLLWSRLIDGLGDAGRSMSYTWVAIMIPRDQQRTIFTVLSSTRTAGMILGPITTTLVAQINTEVTIFGTTVPLNSYNSIGLIMVLGEIIIATLMLLFLCDPPQHILQAHAPNNESKKISAASKDSNSNSNQKGIWYAIGHFNIIFPIFIMFCVMSSFNLQKAFAPVAKNIGWQPVQISEVTSIGAALMALGMLLSGVLSMQGVTDTVMISTGFTLFFLSGLGYVHLWHEGANFYELSLPLFLLMFAYPFIGPANRSKYTKAIHDNSDLEGSVGLLMGVLNQASMLPGIYMPTVVMSFILRTPEDIAASTHNKRELTNLAYYVPIFAVLVFCGLIYQDCFFQKRSSGNADGNDADDDEGVTNEHTELLPSSSDDNGTNRKTIRRVRRASQVRVSQSCSVDSENYRRMSLEVDGIIIPNETKAEKVLMDQLYADKQEWDEIQAASSEYISEEFSMSGKDYNTH